jgi:hypothetical protein
MVKRNFWITLALATLAAGCAAPATPSVAPPASATSTDATTGATAAPTSAATATQAAVKTGFTASDPASVNLAAGRPQLVEFYAVW